MLARKGYLVLPVDELLNNKTSLLEELSLNISECAGRTYIVYNPSIILVDKLNQVIGTGSIIFEPECLEYIPKGFNYYELDKNEWIDTCKLSRQKYFDVNFTTIPSAVKSSYDIIIVSLTRKMIYPRVFNGLRITVVKPSLKLEESYEIIMADKSLNNPIVYFNGKNTVYVAQGSEQLLRLKALLSLEAGCEYYRLLAHDS